MGKWTAIAKTLPRAERTEPSWRDNLLALKDELRAQLPNLLALTAAYRDARKAKEAYDAGSKPLSMKVLALEALLADTFTAEGRTEPAYDLDGNRVEANDALEFKAVDKDALLAWVHANKLERLLSLNPQTMASIARQRLENNEALPDGVEASAYTQIKLVLRKAARE